MKIIFMLPTGIIEWPVPTDWEPTFSLTAMVSQIRGSGFFMADNLYLRHDALIGISIGESAPIIRMPAGQVLQ